ncbi:MAG: hypothetical protein RL033_3085 [Pseudomonadota bacterium]
MRVPSYWLLSLLLTACGASGQTGDGCFSDFDCESSSCSYGSCDSSLVATLILVAELVDDASDPPPAPPSREQRCAGRSEAECSQLPECRIEVSCMPPPCYRATEVEEVRECMACFLARGCPAPCTRLALCE